MDRSDKERRRAANRAAFAAARGRYHQLPPATRQLIKDGFAAERERNPVIAWSRFLEVALQHLPPDGPR